MQTWNYNSTAELHSVTVPLICYNSFYSNVEHTVFFALNFRLDFFNRQLNGCG